MGVFTSACATTAYQGGLFPADFDKVTFVAEPVSNLIHADVLHDKGATFSASRLYENKEFLASTDGWFRPVNMYTGSDGAIYVVDYYRQIIEHPEWMADEVVKSGALYSGTDQGRIYRITPKGTPKATWSKDLKSKPLTNPQLVQKLADPNIWWRRNAQRMLIDRQATAETEVLAQMAASSASPLGRLHALWTLEGLDKLSPELLLAALQDKSPGVRENAIRLAEPFLDDAQVRKQLLAMPDDADPKVRYQLLCTLGFLDSPEAAKAREALLFKDLDDKWVQLAALSARPSAGNNLLNRVLARYEGSRPAYGDLIARLSTMTGYGGSRAEIESAIAQSLQPLGEKNADWQPKLLLGLAQGLKRNPDAKVLLQSQQDELMNAALRSESAEIRQQGTTLLNFVGLPESAAAREGIEQSARVALDQKAGTGNRVAALAFLSLDDPAKHLDLLQKIITPTEPTAVQLAALQSLASIPGLAVSDFVTTNWASLTPDVRSAAINTFFENDPRVARLLDAIEQKIIDPGSLGWPRTVRLMNQRNLTLKNRARDLLANRNDDRQAVVTAYAPALTMPASSDNGRAIYQKNCASCHQLEGKSGVAYGPDLGTIRNRRPASIMGDILNPNFSIADGYDLWNIEMKSGESMQGLITSETPTALTLRYPGGQEAIVARQDIATLKSLGVSVMPSGLENAIDKQEMADLLAFLKKTQVGR